MKNGQFPEIIKLGDLNGQNGFKLDGENNANDSGFSVSAVGDINGDGYADLIIGAPYYNVGSSNIGRSYLVFGGPGIGSSGVFNLASLTGNNGFKLNGENYNGQSGYSVSGAGDINSDGYTDLIIGAQIYPGGSGPGRSYVVFGAPGIGSAGIFNLSSLNGANGFKLDGENNNDGSGSSVSAAGDINGDGYADLIIGAPGYLGGSWKGRSYVVFGGRGVGVSGGIALSGLNGINGFKLDGEHDNDLSGGCISAAGDINGDGHADLIIGAFGYLGAGLGGMGRSYVVFGGPGVGGSGVLSLSNINGTNGFKLDGENKGDRNGVSVSATGDINGDGHDDLIIGADGYSIGGQGHSYVVFGSPNIGSGGTIPLSSLNGANGFKLDGENNKDQSGHSVSAAGDVNGDGYNDLLIGAWDYLGGGAKGRSYVVFGGLGVGSSGVFSLPILNGANGFKLDGENNQDQGGWSVSAVGDINGDGCADLIIGARGYPGGSDKGRSYVVFGDIPPVLVNNSLRISSGAMVSLSASDLAAYDRNHDNNTLVFIPTNLTNGQFESVNNPGVRLNNFTQQQIWDDQILFIHDGSSDAPTYNITVRSSGIAWTGPVPANVTLSNFILENNQLIINQGQVVTLTSDNMKATYENKIEGDLSFLISSLAHGQFEWINALNQPILVFQQQNITDGLVRFIHDNSINAPAYQLAVSNGVITSPPQTAFIDFDTIPVLLTNQLVINQGQSVRITPNILSATHPSKTDDNDLRFDMTALQHGQWSWISAPLNSITSFYQQNISDGLVQFTHDNSILAPAYTVSVTDGRTRSQSQAAQIDFDAIPILLNNTLRINQNETVLIDGNILSATHPIGEDSVLLFNITDIVHGQFNWVAVPDKAINQFYQQNITDRQVQFVHDNSINAPAYTVSATDGRTLSLPQAAQVDFDTIPVLLNNHLRINQGETVMIISDGLSATHPGHDDDDLLQFNLLNITHGQFHWQNASTKMLDHFYQQNITDGLVQFTHDNSTQAPACQVSVTNGRTISSAQAATIDFDASPILLNNSLVINQGRTVQLTSDFLSATHPGGDDKVLLFNISSLLHGKFSVTTSPNNPVFSFYQQNITDQLIQFSHDNSTQAPNYEVSVSDGRITLPSVAAKIDFDVFPILQTNQLAIIQGETVILTTDNLQATHWGDVDGNLNFIISDCQHGQFQWITSLGTSITFFQQQNITDHLIQFTHDNSVFAPGYRVVASDSRLSTTPSGSLVDFDIPPILMNDQLTISQDQTIILSINNLLATQNGTAKPDLIFVISSVTNGGFIVAGNQKILSSNLTFAQQQILDQQVSFSQQGSGKPGYQVSVTDGRITLLPASANVTFYVKPVLTQNQFLVSTGQSTVLTSSNLAATRAGEVAEDLQFLVSSVSQGHFEKRSNPGIDIQSFYQKDVMQQNIQFITNNNTQTPDCRLKVWDSSTDLASDIQESSIILIVNNNFPINQGETLVLTETALKALSNRGHDEQITFTPMVGTVQHGHFALAATPSYVLNNFQQSQIDSHDIVFVPDGSIQTPSAYLSVADGQTGVITGTLNCRVDFDTPPVLQHAYLKTSTSEVIKMTDVNLKAASDFVSSGKLIFEISSMKHGHFADNNDWDIELSNFTQQKISDNQIVFITDDSGVAPEFQVSVWDSRLHCQACPQSAEVVFNTSNSSNSSLSDVLKNAIIGAVASGVVGLLFFALKYKHSLGLQRNARPTIDGEEKETYPDALLLPIAREIFSTN